jgi:hypothetical protein
LIRPLKYEKIRDKLMPSELRLVKLMSKSGELFSPNRKQSYNNDKRAVSTRRESTRMFTIPTPTVDTEKDKIIIDLNVKVSSLKTENMQLRMIINQLVNMGIDLNFKN